ncbi:MAG: SDR family oxidoreductase [Spirochaetales bacterium]|nr:SDR family oxidoreductase [Spirochaetales bacterium]
MKEKIALVTGSSSGIGKSCCMELLKMGNKVVGIDVAASSIENADYMHKSIDITNEGHVRDAISDICQKYGKIDFLVNAAGIFASGKPFFELDLEKWNNVLSVNLNGTFIVSKHAAQVMIRQKYGKIVNIACVRAKVFRQNMADYASSKAAIVALTSAMALDLASYNIQVNAVAPGFTHTGMTSKAFDQPEIRKQSESLIPNGKIAEPDDITPAVIFLLSDGSNNITGTTIFSDGGYSISK